MLYIALGTKQREGGAVNNERWIDLKDFSLKKNERKL